MRAYSINRPVGMGTYPHPVSGDWKIVNFDGRRWVDEIQHFAWGYVDYEHDVPGEQLDRYEMVVACEPLDDGKEELRKYARHVAMRFEQGWDSQAERLLERGVSTFGFDESELYEEVERFLEENHRK